MDTWESNVNPLNNLIRWDTKYFGCLYWATRSVMLVGNEAYNIIETIFSTLSLYVTVVIFSFIFNKKGKKNIKKSFFKRKYFN